MGFYEGTLLSECVIETLNGELIFLSVQIFFMDLLLLFHGFSSFIADFYFAGC